VFVIAYNMLPAKLSKSGPISIKGYGRFAKPGPPITGVPVVP